MNFDDIIESHAPEIWRLAYRMLGNSADAADCVQDALLRAVEFSRRQEVRNWQALLKRLTVGKALDLLRSRRRRLARLTPIATCEEPADGDAGADPAAAAQQAELAAALREALSRVPAAQARAFALTQIAGVTMEQAATELSTSANNVAVLVHRCRARLRELLSVFAVEAPHTLQEHKP